MISSNLSLLLLQFLCLARCLDGSMNSLIAPARVLRSLSTCRIFWRKCPTPEPREAWSVRATRRNSYLKLNTAEQRPNRLCEQLAPRGKALLLFARHKSSKSSKKGKKRMLQDEPDEEEDDPEKSDYEDESEEEEDDSQPKTYKDFEKVVPSFRFDFIMKAGLDMARNKVEDSFYSNKLRLNGEKLLKKSKVVKEGDVLDHLIGEDKEAETVTVMRVMVRKVAEEMTNTDKYRVTLRRWKHLQLPREEVFK
ncbi:mitochondrial transcription rescue factor 1 isoform X1 [Carcharodon carcharias]|uniref:mitochondrial transcription rescue factor 1 isoform X1 n=2 Tax=Carcharodon carcharias TaxID=13397 RepID=UPI001B7EF219|nr:mitochondrial transcription rescue factor 1 isoform X1 [Carcharodon carcharias]